MEFVTLFNRSSKTLQGTFDGRRYPIVPGKNAFPRTQAELFKRQNPLMGTGLYGDMDVQYLLGIVEDNDDITPLEQNQKVEALKGHYKLVEIVPGNGLYSRQDASAPLPVDASFVKA